jgi:hypothetical protein
MRLSLAVLLALGFALTAGPASAQVLLPPGPMPAAPPDPTVQAQETEGLIARLDPATRTIRLDTGDAEYVVLPALDGAWPALAEGVSVKLRYNVDGGRNIVTQIRVGPR